MEGNPHFFQATHIPSFFDHCCEIGTIKSAGVNMFWRNDTVLSSSLVWSSRVLTSFLPWVNCELAMRRRFNHTRCFRAEVCWQPLCCNSTPKLHWCQKTTPVCFPSLPSLKVRADFLKKERFSVNYFKYWFKDEEIGRTDEEYKWDNCTLYKFIWETVFDVINDTVKSVSWTGEAYLIFKVMLSSMGSWNHNGGCL